MHFPLATLVALIPLLASASPITESPRIVIPISKRSSLRHEDGSVNVDALKSSVSASVKYIFLSYFMIIADYFYSKVLRGFQTYEQNTGERHPSDPESHKRAVGEDALTDDEEELWYGMYL